MNNRSDLDDAILDENDNWNGRNLLFTLGSNSQALKAILSLYASQSNRLLMLQKKESPLGQPYLVAVDTTQWKSFECMMLNYLFGKLFRRGPVKTFSKEKYLHDVIQGQSSFLFLPKGLDSGCQMIGSVIIFYKQGIYKQSICLNVFKNLEVQSGFYTSQRFRIVR